MKNLTDFISEQLIMELSSKTYKSAADTAKERGEFDRALKFTRAALNSEIEELKNKYKEQEEKDKDEKKSKEFSYVKYGGYQNTPDAWYKKYHKEIIKIMHSDDVLEADYGQILFKSGLLIGGEGKNYLKGQAFTPIDLEYHGLGISIDYIDFSKRPDSKNNPSIMEKFVKDNAKRIDIVNNTDKESKDYLIKFAKRLNVPQEVIDQAIDICKRLGFME